MEIKLGELVINAAGMPDRDAIHVAVALVSAGIKLYPGAEIGFLPDGSVGLKVDAIGVVDPFLKNPVFPGEKFWMVLFPKTVTNLRHNWDHPAFASKEELKTNKIVDEKTQVVEAKFEEQIKEKDDRITELENYIEDLKQENQNLRSEIGDDSCRGC